MLPSPISPRQESGESETSHAAVGGIGDNAGPAQQDGFHSPGTIYGY